MPWHEPVKRLRIQVFVIMAFVIVGFGVGLKMVSDKADKRDLTSERTDRLNQDCLSRVEARDVLRDVITQAYANAGLLSPEVEAAIAERRNALLARVPELECETKAGIPIPVPTSKTTGTTTTAGAEPVG